MPFTFALRAVAIPVLLAALGGCSFYDDQLAWLDYHQASEQADDQTDMVDGSYKGLIRVEASGLGCPENQNGTLEIGDRSLFFAYTPSTYFILPIPPDGELKGQVGDAMLEGKLENGFIQFVVTSAACRVSYRFRYVV